MVLHAYSGYSKYAWGQNEHRPMSKTGHSANVFGSHSLGITIIDSLDTIFLAELKDSYQKSREWIETQFNPNVVRFDSKYLFVRLSNILFSQVKFQHLKLIFVLLAVFFQSML